EGESECHEREQHLGHEQHPPPVDRVRERATDDGQRQQREELAEREQAYLQRRMRQLVELERGGDGGDLAPEGRDRLSDEPPPEGGVPAERGAVDFETPET